MRQPKLLDRVRATARMRHLSLRTERAYSDWIKRFILFHGKRHPEEPGAEEIRLFLSHLAVEGHVSASTRNVALCALLFLYRNVLGVELPYVEGMQRAKRPSRVPVVFTRQEVEMLLGRLSGAYALIAGLLYGSGLRLMEAVRLRAKDLDVEYRKSWFATARGRKIAAPSCLARSVCRRVIISNGRSCYMRTTRFKYGLACEPGGASRFIRADPASRRCLTQLKFTVRDSPAKARKHIPSAARRIGRLHAAIELKDSA